MDLLYFWETAMPGPESDDFHAGFSWEWVRPVVESSIDFAVVLSIFPCEFASNLLVPILASEWPKACNARSTNNRPRLVLRLRS